MRPLLLEVEDAREHRSLGFVELAVRVRVHYERSQLVRRVRRNLILDHGVHSECTRNQTGDRVDDDYERREDLADKAHHRNRILTGNIRVLPGDSSRHQLADYYMKKDSQGEPGRPAYHTEADRAERASDSRGGGRRGSPVLLVDWNAQSGFGSREDRAHRDEHDDPDQPGRQGASPTMVL
ncbi:MAG TPA: hypothetical protein VN650_13770 [Gemmatimonadaceae bacterium]|nr:hypothetical protein [Gemmatimonadaceae bacterium]